MGHSLHRCAEKPSIILNLEVHVLHLCAEMTAHRKSGCLLVHLMQKEHPIKKYEAWLTKEPPRGCLLLAMIAPRSFQKSCNNVVRVGRNLSEDRVRQRV